MSHHHYPSPEQYAPPEPHRYAPSRGESRGESRGHKRGRSPQRSSGSSNSFRDRSPHPYGTSLPVMNNSHYDYNYNYPYPGSHYPHEQYAHDSNYPEYHPDAPSAGYMPPPDVMLQSAYARGRDYPYRDHLPHNPAPSHDVASPGDSRRRSSTYDSVGRSYDRRSHGESSSRRFGSHRSSEEHALVSPPLRHSSPVEHHYNESINRHDTHAKVDRPFNDSEPRSHAPRGPRDSRGPQGRGPRFSKSNRDRHQRQYQDSNSHERAQHLDTIQLVPSHHSQSIIQSINPVPNALETASANVTPTTIMPIIRLNVLADSDSRPAHPVTGASRKRRSEGPYQPRQSSPHSAKRHKSGSHESSNQSTNHSDDHSNGSRPTKCAYVHLVMKGDSYIPGALVSAYSIRLTNTKHSLVCMVTPEVTEEGRSRLRVVFDEVIEVPSISAHVGALKTAKQAKMYESWVDVAFTKWNCLKLVDYFKVMFIDADKIILANIDHLFELNAPAATFSSPWAQPFVKRSAKKHAGSGLQNPYVKLNHGDIVESKMIELGLTKNSFVLIGTMVLLEPSMHDYNSYLTMLSRFTADRPFGHPACHSMMDEQSLTVLYENELHRHFTFIHQRYNFISWHREWLDDNDLPYVYHYFSTKPWVLKRDSFIDCETWWSLAECLLHDVSRYEEDKLEWIKGCFDATQLTTKGQEGCAWCHASELEEPIWKSHSVFDHEGRIACPELQRREEKK